MKRQKTVEAYTCDCYQERAGIGLGYDAVRRSVLPVRRRWPDGLLVRWRRPEPCEGDGCGLLEQEGKR